MIIACALIRDEAEAQAALWVDSFGELDHDQIWEFGTASCAGAGRSLRYPKPWRKVTAMGGWRTARPQPGQPARR